MKIKDTPELSIFPSYSVLKIEEEEEEEHHVPKLGLKIIMITKV
jgi:hypothetical protein